MTVQGPGPGTNVWEALGLPPTFAPVPVTWHHIRLTPDSPTHGAELHLLMFDCPSGRVAFCFSPEEMRAVADKLTEALSGLQIVRGPSVANGGGPRLGGIPPSTKS